MAEQLSKIVKSNPPYYMATHLLSSDVDRDEVEQWMKENSIQVNWACTSGIFHEAFVHNKMDMFFEAIEDKNVLVVGPEHINQQDKIKDLKWVQVPTVNCWKETDNILKLLREIIDKEETEIVLFCASMAANVWIDKLYKEFEKTSFIDFGSALDPYCGVLSRSFHRKNTHLIK